MDKKETATETKEKLLALTDGFCSARLNKEYARLTAKLIKKMAREKPAPYLRGRLENWAAGIVHAVGNVNFLFDKSFKPYVASPEISAYFGVSQSTMGQKSRVIRDLFGMDDFGSTEFATTHMKNGLAPIMETFNEFASILTPGEQFRWGSPGDAEFVDVDHPAMEPYYELCDRYETERPSQGVQSALEELIALDPDFLDTSLMLAAMRRQTGQDADADRLIDDAAQRALRVITAATGDWPKSLDWGWLENRHLIRALYTKALWSWARDEPEPALDLLRRLLCSNPEDNVGARHQILAIRMGMTHREFETRFNKGGFYDGDQVDWFDKNVTKYPDDFDWWRKAVAYDV